MVRLERLEKVKKSASDFIARMNFPHMDPPIRAYLHGSGSEVFASNGGKSVEQVVTDHLFHLRDALPSLGRGWNFVLASLWGDDGDRMMDFFCYKGVGVGDWQEDPGNPGASPFVMRNGVVVPDTEKTCEDTIIVFGQEGEYRRGERGYGRVVTSFYEYIMHPPEIRGLVVSDL